MKQHIPNSDIEPHLKLLTHLEREILKLRCGIGDGYIYTRLGVAKTFGITSERARQIENRAIVKIVKAIKAQERRALT